MKVEKNLIEKVANNATNIKGKAVEIAKKSLTKILYLNLEVTHSFVTEILMIYTIFRTVY